VTLPTLGIDFFDYSNWQDPPLLFRKEQFLPADHPLYEKVLPADTARGKTRPARSDRRFDLG